MELKLLVSLVLVSSALRAQPAAQISSYLQPALQYYRTNDQMGINVFETNKQDTTQFTGLKVRLGGNFTQEFQSLKHSNSADFVASATNPTVNTNELIKLTNGFNLAMANLNLDAQLADGIRMNVTIYLSSRHHEETWVKNGYLQIDKLAFLKSRQIDSIMKRVTIRVGDLEVDYGDQHFRRTDGGNSIYNPFIENYIMDAFATEIGGEVYYHSTIGLLAMGGITNGQLNPTVVASSRIDSATGKLNTYSPAFHGKIGYDKQLNPDFRLRLMGSVYSVKSTSSNTLFNGDRTGSHYFYAIENTVATTDGNSFSGRYNPLFSQQVNTFSINTLLKYKGIELFGTYEQAEGRRITDKNMRTAKQYAVDLIYRFPASTENFWIGGRYNSVTATTPFSSNDVTINRIVGSAGWFLTRNIMMKAEYVNQEYQNFRSTDIRSGAQFDGFMVAAVVGF